MKPQKDDIWFQHDFDGIKELNNPMPTWWTRIFWGTFFFSIAYLVVYPLGGAQIREEYTQEVKEAHARSDALAAKEGPVTEEILAAVSADPSAVKEGNVKFVTFCSPCHGEHGEGKIGPNLTDAAWINGDGSLKFLYASVNNGYPAKGMVAWGQVLKPDDMKKIVGYVGTLRNTNFPGGKASEGPRAPAGAATATVGSADPQPAQPAAGGATP